MFSDWDPALTYRAKHAEDHALFVQKVNTRLEELYPELIINVEITPKGEAAAA
jgi:hypothetical protein